ncbi:MAG: hypothetical protein ABIJ34_01845 [archaeon]
MAEIPGPVWAIVGIFVFVTSLLLGFIRKIPSAAFFQLMLFVGIGMTLYGLFKIKFNSKTKEDMIEEARRRVQSKGQMEFDIDIDDYRANPALRAEVLRKAHAQGQKVNYSQGTHQHQAPHQQHNTHSAAHQATQKAYPQNPSLFPQQHANIQQRPPQQAESRFCNQCGIPLMKSHKFCPMCGARV